MRFIKIALFFVATVLNFHSNLYAQNDKPFTVVIDAGHGGKDPGNRGNTVSYTHLRAHET